MDIAKPEDLAPAKEPAAQNSAEEQQAPQQPVQSTEGVVFNVMPKDKVPGPMVEAKMKVESLDTPEPAQASKIMDTLKKYKWYGIGGVGVIILGVGIYFLISALGASSYKSEDILAKSPPPPKKAAPAASPAYTTPKDWRDKYFSNCTDVSLCGDSADPDHDGLTNLDEFNGGTDPNNADSDQDGLADGDEDHVFATNPLDAHTAKDPKYTDADYLKGGFDIKTGALLTKQQISDLSDKMGTLGLHQPTLTTLGDVLNKTYNFSMPSNSTSTSTSTLPSTATSTTASATSPTTLDQSIEAKQDRDAQRTNTIKNIEAGLVKYQADNKSYPQTSDFLTMFDDVKAYLRVATNPNDPVNKDPYLYSYVADPSGADFTLAFYSEVAGVLIKKHAADAVKDSQAAQAAIYDDQRKNDLEDLRTALLLYSQKNVAGNQDYVFPSTTKYKSVLMPDFISQIPKDPKTGSDYQYQVSATFNTFTIKAIADNPDQGTTGFLCNQDGCSAY